MYGVFEDEQLDIGDFHRALLWSRHLVFTRGGNIHIVGAAKPRGPGADHRFQTHLVYEFTLSGEVVQTWGTPNEPDAPGQPSNKPTWAVFAPWGGLYVAGSYGQLPNQCAR